MPYYFEALSTPVDEEHLWERLDEILRAIRDDLLNVHFETEEEAVAQVYRKSLDPDDMRFDSWNVARFRETDDRDNLLHFYDLALAALSEVEVAIRERSLSAPFINQWSVLLSCHGFISSAIMARGDDMQSRRAGIKGGETHAVQAQQQWFSHYYLRARARGLSRDDAERAVEKLVNAILDGDVEMGLEFPVEWFEKLLNLKNRGDSHYGRLTKSFRQRGLSEIEMKRLVTRPTNSLPPLDLKLPAP
jgi:hypothetical protein